MPQQKTRSGEISSLRGSLRVVMWPFDVYLAPTVWAYAREHHMPILSSPFFHSGLMVYMYLVTTVPYLIVDLVHGCRQMKIQSGRYAQPMHLLRAIGYYLLSELCVYLPLTLAPILTHVESKPLPEMPPTLGEFLWDVGIILLVSDLAFYVAHYAMHMPFMYRWVHYMHHEFRAPFALSTQAHHPIESIIMGSVVTIPILAIGNHPFTQWFTFCLILWYGVDSHSGYDWGMYRGTGGWLGGAPVHDAHHLYVTCNYGGYFTHLDRIFNTFRTPDALQNVAQMS